MVAGPRICKKDRTVAPELQKGDRTCLGGEGPIQALAQQLGMAESPLPSLRARAPGGGTNCLLLL